MAALTILLIGTCDTKLSELLYVRSCLPKDITVILIDAGRTPVSHPAITITQDVLLAKYRSSVTSSSNNPSDVSKISRAEVIKIMSDCATAYVQDLYSKMPLHGIISIGGSCGTSLASAVMREALPFTFPKLIVSTVASGDTSHIVGESDITLMYSVVDIAGSNSILSSVLDNAAGAIAGMARAYQARLQREHEEEQGAPEGTQEAAPRKKRIAITMFGVTTPCVDAMRHHLTTVYNYEVYVFHATGHGGRAMERFISSKGIDAVIDLTTTEVADEIVGGVMSAGPERLEAAAKAGIPQVLSVGACNMVNYDPRNTLPESFVKAGRNILEHNASVTLVRTKAEECRQIGRFIAQKLKGHCARPGDVQVVLPVGISQISKPGDAFADRNADDALFAAIEEGLQGTKIEVIRDERDINNEGFAVATAERLVRLIERPVSEEH